MVYRAIQNHGVQFCGYLHGCINARSKAIALFLIRRIANWGYTLHMHPLLCCHEKNHVLSDSQFAYVLLPVLVFSSHLPCRRMPVYVVLRRLPPCYARSWPPCRLRQTHMQASLSVRCSGRLIGQRQQQGRWQQRRNKWRPQRQQVGGWCWMRGYCADRVLVWVLPKTR